MFDLIVFAASLTLIFVFSIVLWNVRAVGDEPNPYLDDHGEPEGRPWMDAVSEG